MTKITYHVTPNGRATVEENGEVSFYYLKVVECNCMVWEDAWGAEVENIQLYKALCEAYKQTQEHSVHGQI